MGALINNEILDGSRQDDGSFRLKVDAEIQINTSPSSQIVSPISIFKFTGIAGVLTYEIAQGAKEISISNTGTENVVFRSASMASPFVITPSTQPGATTVSVTAPNGTVLERVSVTVSAIGQSAEILVIR